MKQMMKLSLDVITNIQVLKNASLSRVLVQKAGAYSKLLDTIEMPLHLQLLVPAFRSIKYWSTLQLPYVHLAPKELNHRKCL